MKNVFFYNFKLLSEEILSTPTKNIIEKPAWYFDFRALFIGQMVAEIKPFKD